jgi:hypothetical protein
MNNLSTHYIVSTEPLLLERLNGGWLAVTRDDAVLAIGIVALTAEDARQRFAWAVKEWAALADRAMSELKDSVTSP